MSPPLRIPVCTRKKPKQVAGNLPQVKVKTKGPIDWNEFKKNNPPRSEQSLTRLQRQRKEELYIGPHQKVLPDHSHNLGDDDLGDDDQWYHRFDVPDMEPRFLPEDTLTGHARLDKYFEELLQEENPHSNPLGAIIPACVRSIASIILSIEWEVLRNHAEESMDTPWCSDEFFLCADLVAKMEWEDRLEDLAQGGLISFGGFQFEWKPFVDNWAKLCFLRANDQEEEMEELIGACQRESLYLDDVDLKDRLPGDFPSHML